MFKAPLKNTLKNVAYILGTSPPQNGGDFIVDLWIFVGTYNYGAWPCNLDCN